MSALRKRIYIARIRRATKKALKNSAKPIFPEVYQDKEIQSAFRAYCKNVLRQVRR